MADMALVSTAWPMVTLSPSSGNDSIMKDVTGQDCFNDFDLMACTRNSVLSFLSLITAGLCIFKLTRLYISKHSTLSHYTIFFCAVVECLFCTVHRLLGQHGRLEFVVNYFQNMQFLTVFHLYWTLVARGFKKEKLICRLVTPCLGVALLYFTVTTIVACFRVWPSGIQCLQPEWLALSTAEFVMVQLFLVAGINIIRHLNEIRTQELARKRQQRDLWILIVAFECSGTCGIVFDMAMQILGKDTGGCSGVFLHRQNIYTGIAATFMIFEYLVPIWAMLLVFQPIRSNSGTEDYLPVFADENGHCRSEFVQPRDRQFLAYNAIPGTDFQASDPDLIPHFSSYGSGSSPVRKPAALAPIQEEFEGSGHFVGPSIRRPLLN